MKIEQYLDGLASLHGKVLNAIAGRVFLDALSRYEEAAVLEALKKCSIELRTFPTISDVISRIPDGRPGIEEAWAMIPKTEEQSVVWTEEMQQAYAACSSLIPSDMVAARMAFKETYTSFLQSARNDLIPIKWSISLGSDKNGRVAALTDAVSKNRISQADARKLLPDTAFASADQSPALSKLISCSIKELPFQNES